MVGPVRRVLPDAGPGAGGRDAGFRTTRERSKGNDGAREAPAASCFAKLKNRFQHRAFETDPRSSRSSLDLAGLWPGSAAIWHPAAENAEQRCAAVPGPIAAGLVNFALLVCYIGYRLTPTVPPGDRPPRPPGGRSQCPSSAAAARSVRGEAAVTSEAAPRALGESLSSSDDETWFLVSFWKRAAERVRSACKPIGTRGRGAPVPAGQGTVGPGSAAALGRVPWAEAGEPL